MPRDGERERPLAQHVHPGGERAQHVRLVQMVRRRDHHGIELVELQHLVDVGEDIGNVEPLGERARLRSVVVAERDELRAAQARERGEHAPPARSHLRRSLRYAGQASWAAPLGMGRRG